MYEILTKKYRATWGGILRIVLWTMFFLWIAGFAIPRNLAETVVFGKAAKDTSITSMLPLYTDRRLIREDVAFDSRAINIAWLCDSSCLVTAHGKNAIMPDDADYSFIPDEVSKRLSAQFPAQKIRIYLYARLGPFPTDEQALVAKVIASKPDIIIFHINAMRAYDPFSLAAREASKPELSKIWLGDNDLRPLSFALVSPAENFYAAIGGHFRAIKEMTRLKSAPDDAMKDNAGRVPQETTEPKAPPPTDQVTALKDFWTAPLVAQDPAMQKLSAQWGSFIPGVPDPHTCIYAVFEDTIRSLAANGIPVLIYPTPLAPVYQENPVIKEKLAAVEQRLQALRKRYQNDHVIFIDRIPDAVIQKTVFKPMDPMHEENAEAFVSYMTANITKMINDLEKREKHENISH